MDTLITVFHCANNISVAIHICAGAPEGYISQASGDVYNCLARFERLNKDSEMLVISIMSEGATYWSINQKSECQAYATALTILFEEEEKLQADIVRVVHSNYNIKYYLPY